MNNKVILKNIPYLVPAHLESKLLKASLYEWNDKTNLVELKKEFHNTEIIIDLNSCRFFDPASILQLTIIIQDLLRYNLKMKIGLPLVTPTSLENEQLKKGELDLKTLDYHINAREKALKYLDYIGFLKSLKSTNINKNYSNIDFLYKEDVNELYKVKSDEFILDDELIYDNDEDDYLTDFHYKYDFPLTWLKHSSEHTNEYYSSFLSSIISYDFGRDDASELVSIIINELVENVTEYSGNSEFALIFGRSTIQKIKNPKDFLAPDSDYLSWVNSEEINYVDLAVGDSGVGIYKTLYDRFKRYDEKNKVFSDIKTDIGRLLLWSFDRFSTSKKEAMLSGTRGLYRINRIVKKNSGFISIRSNKEYIGYDHWGSDQKDYFSFSDQHYPLARIPGNILTIRIPIFNKPKPKSRITLVRTKLPLQFNALKLGPITKDGLSSNNHNVINKLLTEISSVNSCLICSFEKGLNQKAVVEKCLLDLSELRHPSALAVTGITINWSVIDGYCESVNEELAKKSRNPKNALRKKYDPILVFDHSNYAWACVYGPKLALLNYLSENDRIKFSDIPSLHLSEFDLNNLLAELKTDEAIFHVDQINETVELRLHLVDILKFINESFRIEVENQLNIDKQSNLYRTPSLNIIKKWINLDNIQLSYLLVGHGLIEKLRDDYDLLIGNYSNKKLKSFLFVDSNSSLVIASLIADFLEIDDPKIYEYDYDSPFQSSQTYFKKGDHVIIYSDLISSGESVKEMLKQILHDGAEPICIITMINGLPKKSEELSLWSRDVRILSFHQFDLSIKPFSSSTIINIDPISIREENIASNVHTTKYSLDTNVVFKLIHKSNSLILSHVKRPLDRHFTFFLKADDLFNSLEVINFYHDIISQWASKRNVKKLTFIYPKSSLYYNPVKKLVNQLINLDISNRKPIEVSRITSFGKTIFSLPTLDKEPTDDFVIVDWGLVTGNTLNQLMLISHKLKAKNVLAIIFMSQVEKNEEEFLTCLKTLQSEVTEKTELFESKSLKVDTLIDIQFLTNLPIFHYSTNNCPICRLIFHYQSVTPTHKYLFDYCEERIKLLNAVEFNRNNKQSVLNFLFLDVTTNEIFEMLFFRSKLKKSLNSTQIRYELLQYINNLEFSRKSNETEECTLRSMMFLLSIETEWLKKPPLNFHIFRESLANISLRTILDSNVEEKLRFASLVVLRNCNKEIFIKNISDLFVSFLNNPELFKELLFSVYTFIKRPYHQNQNLFNIVKVQLISIIEKLSKKENYIDERVVTTVYDLEHEINRLSTFIGLNDLPILELWIKLKDNLLHNLPIDDPHSEYIINFENISLYSEDIKSILNSIEKYEVDSSSVSLESHIISWAGLLVTRWNKCIEMLDIQILPFIKQMEGTLLLLGNEFLKYKEDINKIISIASLSNGIKECELSKIIFEFNSNPNLIFSSTKFSLFLEEYNWFKNFIFDNSVSNNPSLSGLLKLIPINFKEQIDLFITRRSRKIKIDIKKIYSISDNLSLFCPKYLFINVLDNVFANLEKHIEEGKDESSLFIDIKLRDNNIIEIIFNNTNTKEDPKGKGLDLLSNQLKYFDARWTKNTIVKNENNITYSISFFFQIV